MTRNILISIAFVSAVCSCEQRNDKAETDRKPTYPSSRNEYPVKTGSAPVVKKLIQYTQKVNFIDQKGLKQGLWRQYYKNGGLKTEANYLNGVLNGKYTWYYPNGNKHVEKVFKNGNSDEYYRSYFDNGQIEDDLKIKHGLNKSFERYDKHGKVIYQEIYQNGKVVIEGDDTIVGYKESR